MKIFGCYFLTLLFVPATFAQLVEYPIGSYPPQKNKNSNGARTQATVLNLPFWDDFSYSDTLTYPQEDLWQLGKSVFLNNGLATRQPSKNVVTFDGVDSIGKPYNVNDILAKGYADKLVSLPIRMDPVAVDPAKRNTVYFSFFYQVKGKGESPDNGDMLVLSFKDSSDTWIPAYTIENNDLIQPDVFYQVIIPITATRYFHDDFQFRFTNFARLSGPYDTWNVDYVYLNKNRNATDTAYPDRTVSTPLTSLFVDYYSMPVRHFLQNPGGNLKKPSLDIFSLGLNPAGQPMNYSTNAKITTKINQTESSVTLLLDAVQSIGNALLPNEFRNITLNTIPPTSAFNPLADSIAVELKYEMVTKDNIPISGLGDYDPAIFAPIDFRFNDTIRSNYILDDYYAYDDNVAEYGAGLNQAGSYLAIKYKMKSAAPDTLVYVDIYFPQFGDNTSQSIQLQIRQDLSDAPGSILYQRNVVVERKGNHLTKNQFTRYKLEPGIVVSGDFYVGWKQLVTVSIPAGLDKNTDNGDKLFFNTNGIWVQNIAVKGSLMVRPGFGTPGTGGVTGLEDARAYQPIYPNPTTRICYLPAEAENIMAFDITGRLMETEINLLSDKQSLTFLSPVPGIAIVHYFVNGKSRAEKIMVRAN